MKHVICPTITAYSAKEYREQAERIAPFASRVHIDLMDGKLAPTTSVAIEDVWWPHTMLADIHVMYQNPEEILPALLKLDPHMVIVHAEADGNFADLAKKLHQEHIHVGVALLPETPIDMIKPALHLIDHVLIFSGDLGKFGGEVDLKLLDKVTELKKLKPELEFGWDGGINAENAKLLVEGGIHLLNVGGTIQKAAQPQAAYKELQAAIA